MKAAQILSTFPDALPNEYARELSQLQANAPPMGWLFVRRRLAAELNQLKLIFAVYKRYDSVIDTSQVHVKLSERLA
jgi:predicted unusual protein kinase regulating ubiquinone biosynthesis (AarF/ABC1/UbiB family)